MSDTLGMNLTAEEAACVARRIIADRMSTPADELNLFGAAA